MLYNTCLSVGFSNWANNVDWDATVMQNIENIEKLNLPSHRPLVKPQAPGQATGSGPSHRPLVKPQAPGQATGPWSSHRLGAKPQALALDL